MFMLMFIYFDGFTTGASVLSLFSIEGSWYRGPTSAKDSLRVRMFLCPHVLLTVVVPSLL